jgi:hypothetical protein
LVICMPALIREVPQAAGRCVTVHPRAAAIGQDRPAGTDSSSPVDSPSHCGRQRDQYDLGALAAHAQHPVAMFLAEVSDVGASGFEDPQAEQPEHGHQREVARVRRLPGGDQQGLELQVSETEGR